MPAMLMTLKVRLKVRKTAGEKLRRTMGCARFVHNFLLSLRQSLTMRTGLRRRDRVSFTVRRSLLRKLRLCVSVLKR